MLARLRYERLRSTQCFRGLDDGRDRRRHNRVFDTVFRAAELKKEKAGGEKGEEKKRGEKGENKAGLSRMSASESLRASEEKKRTGEEDLDRKMVKSGGICKKVTLNSIDTRAIIGTKEKTTGERTRRKCGRRGQSGRPRLSYTVKGMS